MLEQLLRTERERDETLAAVHDYLTQLANDMREGAIAPEQFLIAKVGFKKFSKLNWKSTVI